MKSFNLQTAKQIATLEIYRFITAIHITSIAKLKISQNLWHTNCGMT